MDQTLSIEEIISILASNEGRILGSSIRGFDNPFEISPKGFLNFAEADIDSNLPHRYVNALSNSKRALDCQIQCVFITLGITLSDLDFPKKLEILNSIGLISPRILLRINRYRNLLEHEFENPSPENVLNALDTAILFIAYTNAKIQKFRDEIVFDSRKITRINIVPGCVNLVVSVDDERKSIDIRDIDDGYFGLLECMIQVSNEWW